MLYMIYDCLFGRQLQWTIIMNCIFYVHSFNMHKPSQFCLTQKIYNIGTTQLLLNSTDDFLSLRLTLPIYFTIYLSVGEILLKALSVRGQTLLPYIIRLLKQAVYYRGSKSLCTFLVMTLFLIRMKSKSCLPSLVLPL